MKPAIFLVGLVLAGCTNLPTEAERDARIRAMQEKSISAARHECGQFGQAEGTPEFAACVERRADAGFQRDLAVYLNGLQIMAAQEDAQRMAAASILANYNAGLVAAPVYSTAPLQQTRVRCFNTGPTTNCSVY